MNNIVKKILKGVGITLIVVTLSGYAVFAAIIADRYYEKKMCNSVIVKIEDFDRYQFITEATVYKALKEANLNPVGKDVTHSMADRMERCVKEINVVRNAICYVRSNGDVIIIVTQREPVYRVITPKKRYYVDSDRKTMPVAGTFASMLPLVTGYVTEDQATGELFDFIEFLYTDPFWKNHIGQVNLKSDGNIELITKIGAEKIVIDNLNTYKEKLAQVIRWYQQYPDMAWSNKYSVVDLRYNNLIYCKKGDAQ